MGIRLIKKTACREDATPVETVVKNLEKEINTKFGSQIVGAFTRGGYYPGVSVALASDDALKHDDIESVEGSVEEYNKTAKAQLGAKESGGESLFGTNATTWDNLVSKSNPDGMALTVYVNLNAVPEKNAKEASQRFVKLVGACLEKVGKGVAETNEAVYKAIRNPGQAAFLIDCGSPEKAKELNDAFYAVAFKEDGWRPNKEVIGGEVIQGWNVGKFFTACVDPCDKAVKWCEDWLRNSDGVVPGIQGNAAGLESRACEGSH